MESAKNILKQKTGSSLPFVLIIGMIMLLLVASLLGVAVNNLNFTQESVESRQGYVDAKSVIEYGKIEINKRITALNTIDAQIKAETNSANLVTLQNQRTALIGALSGTFTVYGVVDDSVTGNLVSDSLSLTAGSYNGIARKALGVCAVTPTDVGSGVTKFAFDLKTQNLRRELSYKIDFNYTVTSFSNWTSTTYPVAAKPDDTIVGNWLGTNILKYNYNSWGFTKTGLKMTIPQQNDINGNDSGVSANVSSLSLNIGKDSAGFAWLDSATLNLTANNIYFTDSFPTNNSGAAFNITASQIVFPGDLTVGDNQTLNIKCDRLWVGGKITLGTNSTLNITGTSASTSQVVVGGKIITTRTADGRALADVYISNLAYFESAGLDLDCYTGLVYDGRNYTSEFSHFELSANNIVIKGDISIEGYGWADPMATKINTPVRFIAQYFDCSGKTSISEYGNPSTPVAFEAGSGGMNIRFAGGFYQSRAHVDIDGATKIIFGAPFYLKSNGIDASSKIVWSHLYVEGGDVYFEGSADDSIQSWDKSIIFGKTKGVQNLYLYNQTKINYLNSSGTAIATVNPGKYSGSCYNTTTNNGTYILGLYYPMVDNRTYITKIGEYPANSTSGTTSTGNEKYY